MITDLLSRSSLRNRVTVFTLAIFLTSIWALAIYAGNTLRVDMQRQLGIQQASTVAGVAAQINEELNSRMSALHAVAAFIKPDMMQSNAALQTFLEQRPSFSVLFNGGYFITDSDGTALASMPEALGRTGVSYQDYAQISIPLREGKPVISHPVIGKMLQQPVFAMAVPIWGAPGKSIGVLVGVIDLSRPSFLDKFTNSKYGESGGFLLEDPQTRTVITATDKSRIMKALPPAGVNALMDRHVAGFDDTGVTVNPMGIEVLASAARVPVAGWFVVATLPTSEAFAPIRDLHRRTTAVAVGLTLVMGLMMWWLLRRELAPLTDAVRALKPGPDSTLPSAPLPVRRHDEVGALISSFNQILDALKLRESELRRSEERFALAVGGAQEGVWDIDLLTGSIYHSPRMAEMLGYTEAELPADRALWDPLTHPDDYKLWRKEMIRHFKDPGHEFSVLVRMRHRDGQWRWSQSRGKASRDATGRAIRFTGTQLDVTEFVQAQEALAQSERKHRLLVENSHDIIYTLSPQGVLTFVSPSWTDLLGHPVEEVLGRSFADFVHPDDREVCRRAIRQICETHNGLTDVQYRIAHLDGSWRWHASNALPWFSETGALIGLEGNAKDITGQKEMEDRIRQLAFFDALTLLPNRRLLTDRLHQALAISARGNYFCGLLVLDLDNFKSLNDVHGHAVGDLLLKEVANRLTSCVRQSDTVARFGGDEFVVMLSELAEKEPHSTTLAWAVAEKIRTSLAAVYRLPVDEDKGIWIEHQCTASIGLAVMRGPADVDAVIQRADAAMYKAKEAGRNQVSIAPRDSDEGNDVHRPVPHM